MRGYLVLEDGQTFQGQWHGDTNWQGVGEVVFNTSMTGYQEILTDPSYFQQIIVMTTPEQGNYGVDLNERECERVWAEGFVCLNLNEPLSSQAVPSKRISLKKELSEFSRPGLSGIDTRALTLHLRSQGTPWGALICTESPDEATRKAKGLIEDRRSNLDSDWVYKVSTKTLKTVKGQKKKGRIALLDYGSKNNIVVELAMRCKEVGIFNSRSSFKDILDWAPDGIFLTNGPGDPAGVRGAVEELKKLLGEVPIFGICMGHQILALALGGTTYKLKFGHRGANHPVHNLETGEIYMTSQNHGYAVSENLPSGVKVTQINLYDKTVEGISAEGLRASSVQYHPEACPGPHDSRVLFDHYLDRITK